LEDSTDKRQVCKVKSQKLKVKKTREANSTILQHFYEKLICISILYLSELLSLSFCRLSFMKFKYETKQVLINKFNFLAVFILWY